MDPFCGGFGLQCGHFSVKMYAKMKELGPVGGVCRHASPRAAYDHVVEQEPVVKYITVYL